MDDTRSNSSSTQCWIGLNDIKNEGIFVWSDGSGSFYRNWGYNQPNNDYGVGNCVSLWHIPDWRDRPCADLPTCYFCRTNGEDADDICGIKMSFRMHNKLLRHHDSDKQYKTT